MIGVLTLEDVIERMLRIDINDEIDREEAVQAFKKRNFEGSCLGSPQVINKLDSSHLAPYMPGKYNKDDSRYVVQPEDETDGKDGIYGGGSAILDALETHTKKDTTNLAT